MKRDCRFLIPALLALAACNSSDIQGDYLSQQDICRSEAELRAAQNAATRGPDTHAGIYFSECMNHSGWRVSMPKPAQTAGNTTPAPPSGAPSTNPTASTSAVPEQTSGGVSPSEGTATIYRGTHTTGQEIPGATATQAQPAGASPAPLSAPTPNPTINPAAARYRPARPTTMPEVPYGTGGGRHFQQ